MKEPNENRPARRGPGRPPTKHLPEPVYADPDEVARSLFNGPPKREWRYKRGQDSATERH